jgi:hypothetical protein
MDSNSSLKTSSWYQSLADHTFPTSFVKLSKKEIDALKEGDTKSKVADEVVGRLEHPMRSFPGNCFVFTDTVAPTDTERFESKRGAVHSAKSAWRFLCESEKTRKAAADGLAEHICLRPFRRVTRAREFRLFIQNGELKGMSQYWLVRHYRRLVGPKDEYWEKAKTLVANIAWLLPTPTVVMDIYITSPGNILIIDFNPWGPPTLPLMLKTWERDWTEESGNQLIPPPTTLSGDVNVSF